MDVNKENIEEYLLLLLDGELDETTATEVIEFIESHAEYKFLMDEYLQARIEPELVVFENKEMLLKHEVIIMPLKKKRNYIVYAAAIAAIIGISVVFEMLNRHKDTQEPSIAISKNERPIIDTSFNQSVVINESKQQDIHKQANKPLLVKEHGTVPENAVATTVLRRPKIAILNSLPVADLKLMEVKPDDKIKASEMIVAAINNTPSGNIITDEDNDQEEQGRRALLNNLIAQVDALKDKVAEKTKSVRISAVSIQLGNKEFTIGK